MDDSIVKSVSDREAKRLRLLARLQVLLIVLSVAAMAFLLLKSGPLARERETLQIEVSAKSEDLRQANTELETSRREVTDLRGRVADLRQTEQSILHFLGEVLRDKNLRRLEPDVNWDETRASLAALPAGRRKNAVLGAFLLASKSVPSRLTGRGFDESADSTDFIRTVLNGVGVETSRRADTTTNPRLLLPLDMMRTFKKTESPSPGDLLFYQGRGTAGLMYLRPGRPSGHGIAVGTLTTDADLRVMDTATVNPESFRFLGYWAVDYEALDRRGTTAKPR